MKTPRRRRILEEAWIGDAVLSLYARSRILGEHTAAEETAAEHTAIDSEALERMTSNHFLAAFGEPSEVEAEIGRVYRDHGLDRAFAWIEEKLMPVYRRQEEKRLRQITPKPPVRTVS